MCSDFKTRARAPSKTPSTERAPSEHVLGPIPNILLKYENKSKHGFKKLFRMTKSTFDLLYEELSAVIPDGRSVNGRSMTGKESLLTFLYSGGK